MTDKKHVHKLKKVKYKSGNATFFCTLPDCTYKINPALALGKRAICWRCDQEFLLNEYSLRLTRPHCSACHKLKGKKEERNYPINTGIVQDVSSEILLELSLSERLQREIEERKEDI